jgi:hypothetical protein
MLSHIRRRVTTESASCFVITGTSNARVALEVVDPATGSPKVVVPATKQQNLARGLYEGGAAGAAAASITNPEIVAMSTVMSSFVSRVKVRVTAPGP